MLKTLIVFPTILTIPTIPAEFEGWGEGGSDSENSDRIPMDSEMLKKLIQWVFQKKLTIPTIPAKFEGGEGGASKNYDGIRNGESNVSLRF